MNGCERERAKTSTTLRLGNVCAERQVGRHRAWSGLYRSGLVLVVVVQTPAGAGQVQDPSPRRVHRHGPRLQHVAIVSRTHRAGLA